MRVIAALFGPYAPDALPAHISVFSHDFKRFKRLTKLATSSLKRSEDFVPRAHASVNIALGPYAIRRKASSFLFL